MSVLLVASLAITGGVVTALLAARRGPAFAIGLLAAAACVAMASSIRAEDTVPLAGTVIGGSDGLRTLALAWAASTFLFGLMDALLGDGPHVLGPSLVSFGLGTLGLSVADAGIGLATLTSGAIVAAVLPIVMVRGGPAAAPGLGIRSMRPVVGAGGIAILAVAWGASPVGPFSASGGLGAVNPALETSLGLALLAVAGAVVLRLGAIPAHAWIARFTEALPASAAPPLLGWGAAAFALVALGWVDLTISSGGSPLTMERGIITIFAVTSIGLGGMAAVLHDDLEHVLAYSMVQDAGVALLAFATQGATAVAVGGDWLVAAVAVKSGLAAWVLVTRSTFRAHRRVDLQGWARRSPILGVALVIVFVGAVGFPGMAGFDARATLIRLALPGPVGILVLIAAFAPVIVLGRLLLSGVDAMSGPVRDAGHAVPRRQGDRPAGWAEDPSRVRSMTGMVRANRYPLAGSAAILAALVGLSVAIGGLGSTAVGGPSSGGQPGPTPAGLSDTP